jgi:hypothetical protein
MSQNRRACGVSTGRKLKEPAGQDPYRRGLPLTRPFALEGFDGQFMQRQIKVSARSCKFHNSANRGCERDLVRWAKAISGTQSAVYTQDGLYHTDANAFLQTQALS